MVQPQYNPYFSAPGAMWQNYWQPAQPHPHPVTGMQMAYMQQQPINANAAMYYQQPQSSSAGAPVPERAAGTPNVKNPRGRPKKRKSTDKDPDYLPPDTKETQSSLEIPKRTALDVSIADSNRTKCAICSFWVGRYLLAPCYHYSFCIECIEKSVNQKSPVCPVCSTPIEKFVLGCRSTFQDTLILKTIRILPI
ncbi:RNA-binding E3 ubiquitin-protein ligase MEX3C [Frankliniella fusca]|uniref:RNA-binding E3 ubiquitin-protein ligase MEX3C n=1 Tax=Frankliniella fusca TaxID=407009 RepID=A0AAE1H8U9_9NEOP|nr:RNA-binding E3 ubiquitin-protein ligase MEX3C [Frankliniella fusca]